MKTYLVLPVVAALLTSVGMTSAAKRNPKEEAAVAASASTTAKLDSSPFQKFQGRKSSGPSLHLASVAKVNTIQQKGNEKERRPFQDKQQASAAGTFQKKSQQSSSLSSSSYNSSSCLISTFAVDNAMQKTTRLAAAALHGAVTTRRHHDAVPALQEELRGCIDTKDRPMMWRRRMLQPPSSSILHVSWLRGGGNGDDQQYSSSTTTPASTSSNVQEATTSIRQRRHDKQEALEGLSSSSFSNSNSSIVVASVSSSSSSSSMKRQQQRQAKLQVSLSEPLLTNMNEMTKMTLFLFDRLRGGGTGGDINNPGRSSSMSTHLGTRHQPAEATAAVTSSSSHGPPVQQSVAVQGRRLATASSTSNVVVPATVRFQKKRQAEIHGLSLSSPFQGLQIQQQQNKRQDVLEKLRGGGVLGTQLDPATTCKFAIHFVLLQGLLQQVAPSMCNRRLYGIVTNTPLQDVIMENLGTTALSFGLAAYCIVLHETSLATAIQVSCIPWIYISLGRFLSYPQSKPGTSSLALVNTDQTPRHVHLMIVLEMLLVCHAVARLQQRPNATDHWALEVLQGHCVVWFLHGLGLVLNPVATTKLLWCGLPRRRDNNKDKDTIILPGVAIYLQRNFGYSLLAWSTFISAMILWDVDPRTSMGYGWIFWALLHLTGTLLTRECTMFGIPQAPQYAWLLFHAAVVATILF